MKTKRVTKQDASSDLAQPPIVTVLTQKSNGAKIKLLLLSVAGVILLAGAIVGGILLVHYRDARNDRALYTAQQQTLQNSFSIALSQSDYQGQVNAASQLISGKMAGHFTTINNNMLAQYYMERGAAYMNLQRDASAVSDFQKARTIDPTVAQASLQAEVKARYDLGQRQQLIPLLQQLIAVSKKSLDQRSGTPALYQQYIEALQHNQEIVLP